MTDLPDQKTHVVVIGGGYAGTLAANRLRQRPDIEITLVNSRPVFVERIRLHQLSQTPAPPPPITPRCWAREYG
jgi:NADH dehydrogenase